MWQVLWPQKVMESWCSLFMQASKLPSTVKKEKCLLSDNILDLHSDLQTPAQTFTYTSMFKCKTHFLNNSTKSAAGFQLHEVPHPPSFNIHHHISLSSYSNRRIPIWILARRGVRGCQLRVSAYTGTNAHTESLWWRKCITVHIYIFTDRWSVLCVRSTMCVKTASSLFSEALLRNYGSSKINGVMVRMVYCCRKVWDRFWPSSQKTVCFPRPGERKLKTIIFHQFLTNQIKFGKAARKSHMNWIQRR